MILCNLRLWSSWLWCHFLCSISTKISEIFTVIKLGHLEKYIRNTMKVLKCGLRRMEKTSWKDRVTDAWVLHRVEEKGNNLPKIEWRKVGHVWRMNYLLTRAIEGNIEGTKGRGRRCKQLLDDLKKKTLNLKAEALGGSLWRTRSYKSRDDLPKQDILPTWRLQSIKTQKSNAEIVIGNFTVLKRGTPMLLVGFDFLTCYPIK